MDGNLAPGSGVTNFQQWNDTILSADAADINCADVHWYPINGTPTENVQSIMSLVDNIPAAAAEVHTALSTYDPSAYFVVGETNMSQTANAWNEEPADALFAAANAMEWLSFGAQSVDWWDVHNYGSPTADFGTVSGNSVTVPAESVVVLAGTGSPPGTVGNTVTVTSPGNQTGSGAFPGWRRPGRVLLGEPAAPDGDQPGVRVGDVADGLRLLRPVFLLFRCASDQPEEPYWIGTLMA